MRGPVRALSIAVTIAAAALPAFASWTATGSVSYRDREFDSTGFTGNEPLADVRFADVEIVDNGTGGVLASGATDASGAFSIFVSDSLTRDVYARVLTRSLRTSDLFLEVTDGSTTPYAIASPVFFNHGPNDNLNMGSLVAEIGQGGEAFNLYDMGVFGSDYIAALQGNRPGSSSPLTIYWGASRGQGASSTLPNLIDMRDTAGYDDTVLLHEYAHFAVFEYSDNDNTGGPHSFSDCTQESRLAWDEGHATYFGCAARRHFSLPLPHIYIATTGGAGPGNLSLYADLETESEFECSGSTSEVSIFTALWDITDGPGVQDDTPGVDDAPVDTLDLADTEHWEVMTDGLPGRFHINAEDYWDAWFEAPVFNGFLQEMISIFGSGVEIRYFEDPYEPNDFQLQRATVQADGQLIPATFFQDPEMNGSGGEIDDEDFFDFQATAGVEYHIETLNLLSEANTWLRLYDDDGPPALASNDNRSLGDLSSFIEWTAPSSGTYIVRVIEVGSLTPYGSYDLRITPTTDTDMDGVPDPIDVCPFEFDPTQANGDNDSFGDACDNCPAVDNEGQEDNDLDGTGDACDTDLDGDGVDNGSDCAPDHPLTTQVPPEVPSVLANGTPAMSLTWGYTIEAHVYDLYRGTVPAGQPFGFSHACLVAGLVERATVESEDPLDGDLFYYFLAGRNRCGGGTLGSGAGGERPNANECGIQNGADDDQDGVEDLDDSCPTTPDPLQADGDTDRVGDACDNCPATFNPDQADADSDGTGDACAP